MGKRKTQKKNTKRQLPKGVYLRSSGKKWEAKVWDEDNNLTQVGTYSTPEEAEYQRTLLLNKGEHHWEGVSPDPEGSWGFIYRITCKASGRMYIGKKQYRLWNGPVGGFRCTDPQATLFDELNWKPNNWNLYTGSQADLNMEIQFTAPHFYKYELLENCSDALDLHMAEVNLQIKEDVLESVNVTGEYTYYNRNIAGLAFRPPFLITDMVEEKEKSMEAVRVYYIKPMLCAKCKSIVPFPGGHVCATCA